MADLIDRDAIFPLMERKMDMQDLYLPVHFMDFVINEIPSVNQWIQCKSEMPKDNRYVLFCVKRPYDKKASVYSGRHCTDKNGKGWWTNFFAAYMDYEVTHWQAMPEPPEEVQE